VATRPILGRDVYLALAAVAWADGQLSVEAGDAIVRTALEEGIDLDTVQEIEQAVTTPQTVGSVNRLSMSKSDRLFVYAVASWITLLDGRVTEREEEQLSRLAMALSVPAVPRAHADAIMREIATKGDRPAKFDLFGLRRRLDEELELAHAARLARG
jgi:hypothetical protein